MLTENHPKLDKRRAAQEKLIDATAAQKRGEGSKIDVSLAQIELNIITDEIDEA